VAEPRSYTVTRADVEVLLRLGGLEPGALASLRSAAAGAGPAELSEAVRQGLEREGWLSGVEPPRLRPECRAALATVAAPAAVMRIALGSAAGIRTLDLYGPGADGGWVRLDLEDAAWGRFEFPLGEDRLVERAADALDLRPGLAVPGLSVRWSWDRYRVLLGMADVFRAACLEAILRRTDPPVVTFTAAAVAEAWRQAVERPHAFWAASVAGIVSPGAGPLDAVRIAAVLEELGREGYLSARGGGAFQARLAVQEFAVSLLLLPAFLGLARATPTGLRPRLAALRGGVTLWRLEFFEAGAELAVEISACGPEEFTDRLRAVLREAAGVPSPATRLMSAGESETRCGGCGRVLRPGARFCAGCGRGVAASFPTCAACGHRANRPSRFCTRCSAPLPTASV